MSEKEEKDRHKVVSEPTVIVVNQQSEHRTSYPADLQEDANKRATIPSIPSTPATVANLKEASTAQRVEGNKQENSEGNTQIPVHTVLSKHQASAKLSSPAPLPEIVKPFDDIDLGTMESEPVLKVIPSEPIPIEVKPTRSRDSLRSRKSTEASEEDDVAGLPAREATRLSDWSDEQEAGGLPRSESRASRVSRAVRQLFCCGVAFAPASEDDISTHRAFSAI